MRFQAVLLGDVLQERRRKRLERRSKGLRLGRRAVEEVKDERAMPEQLGQTFSDGSESSGGAIATAELEKQAVKRLGSLLERSHTAQQLPLTRRLRCCTFE